MGVLLFLFISQVLTVQHVFSYPLRDYILAYLSLVDYAYLTNSKIQFVPINYYDVAYPDIYNTGYYNRLPNSLSTMPWITSPNFEVYTVSSPLPISRTGKLTTVTVLDPVSLPEATTIPSVPVEVTTPILPTNPTEVIDIKNDGVIIENAVSEPVVLAEPAVIATPSISDNTAFSVPVPVAGRIKIYANFS